MLKRLKAFILRRRVARILDNYVLPPKWNDRRVSSKPRAGYVKLGSYWYIESKRTHRARLKEKR